jgi:hypothetical protein
VAVLLNPSFGIGENTAKTISDSVFLNLRTELQNLLSRRGAFTKSIYYFPFGFYLEVKARTGVYMQI